MDRIRHVWMGALLLSIGAASAQQAPVDAGRAAAAQHFKLDPAMERRLNVENAVVKRDWSRLVTESPSPRPTFDVAADMPVAATPAAPLPDATVESRPSVNLDEVRNRIRGAGQASLISEAGAQRLPAAESRVELQPEQILSVATGMPAIKTEQQGQISTASPTMLFALDGNRGVRVLSLVHRTAGLHWMPDKQAFVGQLLIGLVDRLDSQASEPLQAVVPVQLLAAPEALSTKTVTIDRIGIPFQSVDVRLESPDDPFAITLVSSYDGSVPAAQLKINRPHLMLTGPKSIQGLGIEVARITVQGRNTRLRPQEALTFELDRPGLLQDTVSVDEDGTAEVRIRSNGLGEANLSLASGVYAADPKKLQLVPPWPFALSTLAGAALGALVFAQRARGSRPRRWLLGLIIGFVGTVMAYVGLRLPVWIPVPEHLVGEAVPFALAFLCALSPNLFIRAQRG